MTTVNLTGTLATRATFYSVALDSVRVSWTWTPRASCSSSRGSPLVLQGVVRSNNIQDRRKSLLSSDHCEAFGKFPELVVRSTSSTVTASGSGADETWQGSKAVAAFTPEQGELVRKSWQLLKKDAGKHGLTLFLKVFDIAPSTVKLFSFLKDSSVPLEKNPQLKAHGLTVFKLVGDAAYELGEKGELDALRANLLELGAPHYAYGILSEHFDVVKYALLQTIQEGLPEMWSPELKGAWAQAYDEVVATIKGAMEAVKANKAAATAA